MRMRDHFRRILLLETAGAFSLAVAIACASSSPPASTTLATSPPSPPPPTVWSLVWSDEFDGSSGAQIDASKWNYETGDGCPQNCGWGNNEKEYYTNSPENIALNGIGQLMIVARRAPAALSCYYGPCRYTSAKITTRNKMIAPSGRVEARIKLPKGQGLWPAFWMLGTGFPAVGWPACGEIDIIENKGSQPTMTSSALHGPGYSGNTPFAHVQTFPNGGTTDEFHVYAVEWDSQHVEYFVDGGSHYKVSRAQAEAYGRSVLGESFFVITNLAVGGHFDGDPQSDAIFPATMLVDYVRVYAPK
jgi:beta-glucanase (GH16 family)